MTSRSVSPIVLMQTVVRTRIVEVNTHYHQKLIAAVAFDARDSMLPQLGCG